MFLTAAEDAFALLSGPVCLGVRAVVLFGIFLWLLLFFFHLNFSLPWFSFWSPWDRRTILGECKLVFLVARYQERLDVEVVSGLQGALQGAVGALLLVEVLQHILWFLSLLMSGWMSPEAVQVEQNLETVFKEVTVSPAGGERAETCRLQDYFVSICAPVFLAGQITRAMIASEEHGRRLVN